MPKHLTEAQVETYRQGGYAFPMNALSADEAKAAHETIERFERDTGLVAHETMTFKTHTVFGRLSDIVSHPRVLDAVEDVLGPNILCWGSSMFVKDPRGPKYISWHADTYYYGLEPAETLTAWVAFTPSNELSGCIKVLPGSHRMNMPFDEKPNADNLLGRGQTTRDVDESLTVPMPLEPGQFSMHHECVVHGSEPNRSDWRRIGYAIHYCATDMKMVQYAASEKPGAVLVRGEDEYGHWAPESLCEVEFDQAALDELIAYRKRFLSRKRA